MVMDLKNVILSGNKLIALADNGELSIVEATPNQYNELARKKVLMENVGVLPILSNGSALARSTKEAICIDARTR